jgi:lysophospholipid acyltransferase (LPLAT)-like uncharacterized protein
VPPLLRQRILEAANPATAATAITERQAAKLLDIAHSTLCHWRLGKWDHAPFPFPFQTWLTPAGRVRYDRLAVETCALRSRQAATAAQGDTP